MSWFLLLACVPDDGPTPCEPDAAGQVQLPADDAVHDEETEWWYWTGHLSDDDGARYGYELVFFLFGAGDTRGSLVNAAITDIDGQSFRYDADWEFLAPSRPTDGFAFDQGPGSATGGDGTDTLRLSAGPATLELELESLKPPALHHGDGYTDYAAGGYSWYYSRSRMGATGTLSDSRGTRPVTGTSWFDHQWGQLQDAADVGWDWFALTLDNGEEYMLFQIRDGDDAGLTGGTWMDPGCGVVDISQGAVAITSLGSWTSPWSGCTYPMGWTIQILNELYTVTPVLEDQELVAEADETYWEGAATVVGPITGRAYVELTGYCG